MRARDLVMLSKADSLKTTEHMISYGVVHEVRHARGGGDPRRCDSLW